MISHWEEGRKFPAGRGGDVRGEGKTEGRGSGKGGGRSECWEKERSSGGAGNRGESGAERGPAALGVTWEVSVASLLVEGGWGPQ